MVENNSCPIWTQIFNQTQFCILFDDKASIFYHPPKTLSDILSTAAYCDNDSVESNGDLYHVTIVRFKLVGQAKCESPPELLLFTNSTLVYRKSLGVRLNSESCYCPKKSWSESMKCDSGSNQVLQEQINSDLK